MHSIKQKMFLYSAIWLLAVCCVIKFIYKMIISEKWAKSPIFKVGIWWLITNTIREVIVYFLVIFLLWNFNELNKKTLQLARRIEEARMFIKD